MRWKVNRKILAVILCAASMIGLSGCQTQFSLRDRLLIQGMGVDYADGQYNIYVQALDISEDGNTSMMVYETKGDTVIDSLNNVTLQVGKKPVYSHNLTVVLGRSTAEHGLQETIDFFVRHPETRASAKILMAQDRAEEIVTYKRDDKIVPITDLEDLIKQSDLNGKCVNISMVDLVNLLDNSSTAPYLPAVGLVNGELFSVGTALFNEQGFFKDLLTSEETRGLLFLTGQMEHGIEVLSVEEDTTVSLEITMAKTDIKPRIVNGLPVFEISVYCTANVDSIDGGPHQVYGEQYYSIFSQKLEESIKKQMEDSLEVCIHREQADVFSFGRRLHQAERSWWKEHEADWTNLMTHADYKIDVTADIARVGQELSPTLGEDGRNN
ncbi:MAG: Ger(x)C family spore germination protein [Mediterraneibacter sp.]|uniref:Ger(x)C family spore germination protein n=1 Tax=Hydrogeniiclostridium mannosilyticum TaxID=2764322 RepID=UPI00399C3A74